MRRAILTALGIGVIVSGATALDIAGARPLLEIPAIHSPPAARTPEAAREEQRALIERRYRAEREACESLGGHQRDNCLVHAHANRGRAMLQAAAPYQVRF